MVVLLTTTLNVLSPHTKDDPAMLQRDGITA
jgi:hypothetical protein